MGFSKFVRNGCSEDVTPQSVAWEILAILWPNLNIAGFPRLRV